MVRGRQRGMTLTEVVVAAAIFSIVMLGLAAFMVPFSQNRLTGLERLHLNSMMDRVKTDLFQETKGSSWFTMDKSGTAYQNLTYDDYPGYNYDVEVDGIQNGVRQAIVTVRRVRGVQTFSKTERITLFQHQGRDIGGKIRVKAYGAAGNEPVPGVVVSVPKLEGTGSEVRTTLGNGEALVTGTALGATQMTVNTAATPYYFAATTTPLQPAQTQRILNVTLTSTEQLYPLPLAKMPVIDIWTYKRIGSVNTPSAPISAGLLIYRTSDIFGDPPALMGPFNTDGSGHAQLAMAPGVYRVTAGRANVSANEIRVGPDYPNTYTNSTLRSFTIATTDLIKSVTFYMTSRGDLSGSVAAVTYSAGNYYNTSGVADGAQLQFTQDSSKILYPDPVGSASYSQTGLYNEDLSNSVVVSAWYPGHYDLITAPVAGGNYTARQIGPGAVYFDPLAFDGTYPTNWPPEKARVNVDVFANASEPAGASSIAPVLVQGSAWPGSRTTTKFLITFVDPADGQTKTYMYPIGASSSAFQFQAQADTALSGMNVNAYAADPSNYARIHGNILDTIPGDAYASGGRFHPTPSGSDHWQCETYVWLVNGGGTYNRSFQLTANPNNVMAVFPQHIDSEDTGNGCNGLQSYDFSNILPSLGSDQHGISFTARKRSTASRFFNLTAILNYCHYNSGTNSVDYLTNNSPDTPVGTKVHLQIQYDKGNNNWLGIGTDPNDTVTAGQYGSGPFSSNVKEGIRYSGFAQTTSANELDPGANTPLDISLSSTSTGLSNHRIAFISGPNDWRPAPHQFPISPAYDDTTQTYSAQMVFQMVSHIEVYGRVYGSNGNAIAGATIRIYTAEAAPDGNVEIDDTTQLDTAANPPMNACSRTPCPTVEQYDHVINVPHVNTPWNFYVHVEVANYFPIDAPAQKVTDNNTPSQMEFDFPLVPVPGSGL